VALRGKRFDMANESIPPRPTLGQHRNRKCGCRQIKGRDGTGRLLRACNVAGTPEYAQRTALERLERAEARIRLEEMREEGHPHEVAKKFETTIGNIRGLLGGGS